MGWKFLVYLKEDVKGGERIEDIEALLYPLDWYDNKPPEMWGPSNTLYLIVLEKRYRALLYPLDWHDNEPPEMWDPSDTLYLIVLEKRFRYREILSSDNDEDIKKMYAKIDDSTVSLIFDLGMNAV